MYNNMKKLSSQQGDSCQINLGFPCLETTGQGLKATCRVVQIPSLGQHLQQTWNHPLDKPLEHPLCVRHNARG